MTTIADNPLPDTPSAVPDWFVLLKDVQKHLDLKPGDHVEARFGKRAVVIWKKQEGRGA